MVTDGTADGTALLNGNQEIKPCLGLGNIPLYVTEVCNPELEKDVAGKGNSAIEA